tara:strand:- start:1882 stop:2052 length:171 start_codon:yes stop_codon:yes gene_type:complete
MLTAFLVSLVFCGQLSEPPKKSSSLIQGEWEVEKVSKVLQEAMCLADRKSGGVRTA